MTHQAPPLLALSAGLLVALGSACSAHADIPEVVITQSEITFEGVPQIAGITVPTALTTSFDHPEGFDLPEFLDPELRPLGARIIARDTSQDLAFIESLSLTIASRSPDGPEPTVIASYTREDTGEINAIDILANSEADILQYWDTETAFYQLSVNGELPVEAWGVDVVVKFAGSLSVATQ